MSNHQMKRWALIIFALSLPFFLNASLTPRYSGKRVTIHPTPSVIRQGDTTTFTATVRAANGTPMAGEKVRWAYLPAKDGIFLRDASSNTVKMAVVSTDIRVVQLLVTWRNTHADTLTIDIVRRFP